MTVSKRFSIKTLSDNFFCGEACPLAENFLDFAVR